jgi:lipoyl(octanoyl) transferase
MDLAPFSLIDPCGYPGLAVTQLRDLGPTECVDAVGSRLAAILAQAIENA